jgi:hypothetical protein
MTAFQMRFFEPEVIDRMSIISDVVKFSRLAIGMRGFFRNMITLEECQRVIATRLRNREKNFLNLVRTGIYQNPKSPYLKLLRLAGCEFGDIESNVNQTGLDATLQKLLLQGVYLNWEEFKGKKEVIRGSSSFRVAERDFDNPFLQNNYTIQSSGSRSAGARTIFDLEHQANISYYRLLVLAANNALNSPSGIWKPVLPASSGIVVVLQDWKAGNPVTRWFSPVNEHEIQSPLRHRLALRFIIYGARFWGARLVKPEYVGIQEAVKVARWIAETKKQFGKCSFDCYVSLAVKICQAAIENGLDIQGTFFTVSGEPLTAAKRRQIESAGVVVINRYSISEMGQIGYGCTFPDADDDVHFFHDSFGLVQRQKEVEPADIHSNTFFYTTLLSTAPKIMLNVESDDYGVVETRSCSCLFGQLGFNTHLHDIRSYSKLTGVGMTILNTDFVRILEENLPDKYGGDATDYQLLEEEDGDGNTHLSLIISPTIGTVNESEVIATVLQGLRRSPNPGKLAAGIWSQAETIQVKRMYPIPQMGKVLSLHVLKKK